MEGRARDARVIAVATEGDEASSARPTTSAGCPTRTSALSPILAVIPLQLFAYSHAQARGHGRRPAAQPREVGHGRIGRWLAPPAPDRPGPRRASVPQGTTELGIDIIKVDRIAGASSASGALLATRS
jgi:hypothetical protein